MFLKAAINHNGIPFELKSIVPNTKTREAFAEYYEMKKNPSNYKLYDSFQNLINEVFQKRFKACKKRGLNLKLLSYVVDILALQKPLDAKYRDHIEPNRLLVYRADEEQLELFLFRTETHSDLFWIAWKLFVFTRLFSQILKINVK